MYDIVCVYVCAFYTEQNGTESTRVSYVTIGSHVHVSFYQTLYCTIKFK